MIIPVFTNQTFKQVISICEEFSTNWENLWQFKSYNELFDVYIYGDCLYTKESSKNK